MQTPTCKNVRIRSIQDVHKIFAAVERGWLKMITRRLDTDERMELCSGCIYVWEERGPNAEVTGLGMERFTEGRRWSPSRVRDDFLFYFEQYSGGDGSDNQPPRDWDPLIKQTYSALVQTPRGIRKWHMTAYYTESSMDNLGSIDDIDGMRDLVVPEGTYTSHKATKNKAEKKKKPGVTRKYAGFPQPATPAATDSPSTQPVHMFDPYVHPPSTQYYERSDAGTSTSQHSLNQNIQPSRLSLDSLNMQPLPLSYSDSRSALSALSTRPQMTPQMPAQILTPAVPNVIHLAGHYSSSPYTSPASYPSPGSSSSSSSSHSGHSAGDSPLLFSSERAASTHTPWLSMQLPSSERPLPAAYPDNLQSPAYPSYDYPPLDHRHPSSAPAGSMSFPSSSTNSTLPTGLGISSAIRSVTDLPVPQAIPLPDDTFQTPPSPVSDDGQSRRVDAMVSGPSRDLAPLHVLKRNHPYRRDPVDDNALRKLERLSAGPSEADLSNTII